MRYIKDFSHPQYKIGIYQWNGKYIIKFEAGGMYEQTYKVDETEITSLQELETILDEAFIEGISKRFEAMHKEMQDSLVRNGIIF
jgi:hypothetical protein